MTALKQTKKSGRIRSGALWLAGLMVLGLVGILFANRQPGNKFSSSSDEENIPTFEVAEGPLTISVTESGTIRPREQVILKNEVEGQTSIIFLIDEGAQVKKGDLLVELDSSAMSDQKVTQEIQVYNAEAAFIQARENLEVVKNQAKADIDKATLDLDFAKQDLNQYLQGEFPKLEKASLAQITLSSETLANAKITIDWSKRLYKEKYLSESDLRKDELTAQKAQLDLELAREDLGLLKNYTYKRQVATYESNVSQTSMTLARTLRKASADIAQAEAQLKAKDAEYTQQKDQLAKVIKQIEKTKIVAPMDGTVIYATSVRSDFHGNQEPLDEGQAVRERQELIYLPTTASFNTEIKVHESSLDKIQIGMPVLITVDALPGRSFTGRVATIAPLPDSQSFFMNPDLKVYNTTLTIDGDVADLRNGMSCKAEIIVDEYPKATYVPIQAVMRVAGTTVAYVRDGDQYKKRPIKIGLDNNRMVHILDGLKPGETVMLAPPLSEAESAGSSAEDARKLTGLKPTTTTLARTGGPDAGGGGERRGFSGKGGSGRPGGPGGGEGATDQGGGGERRGFSGKGGSGRPGGPGGGEGASDQGGGGERRGFSGKGGPGAPDMSNMTPEQREAMRQRFQNMSPDERAKMRTRGSGSGGPGGGRSGGSRSGGGPGGDRSEGAPGGGPAGGNR